MKKEKSCGAVVFRQESDKHKVLLIKHINGGHWSFPKGHVEKDETEEETATREIFEETGLTVHIDTKFRCVTTYCPKKDVIKDVIYFLALANEEITQAQETEVSDILWVFIEKAKDIIS